MQRRDTVPKLRMNHCTFCYQWALGIIDHSQRNSAGMAHVVFKINFEGIMGLECLDTKWTASERARYQPLLDLESESGVIPKEDGSPAR